MDYEFNGPIFDKFPIDNFHIKFLCELQSMLISFLEMMSFYPNAQNFYEKYFTGSDKLLDS